MKHKTSFSNNEQLHFRKEIFGETVYLKSYHPTAHSPFPLSSTYTHFPVLFNYFNKELFKETYSNHRRPSQNEFNKFYDNHVQNIWIKILIFISNTLFPGFQY